MFELLINSFEPDASSRFTSRLPLPLVLPSFMRSVCARCLFFHPIVYSCPDAGSGKKRAGEQQAAAVSYALARRQIVACCSARYQQGHAA